MKTQLNLILGILFYSLFSCNKDEFKLLPVELINPSSGETEQPLNTILEWKDPNPPNNYFYDIFLGKTAENLELADTIVEFNNGPENPKYECRALDRNCKYYGKIRVRNEGQFSDSEIFDFTTTNKLTSFQFQDKTIMVYPTAYRYEYPDSLIQYSQLVLSGATSWTDGYANTLALIADFEEYPRDGFHIAAKYCYDLNAYGYTDWYLPAIVELDSTLRNHVWLYTHLKSYWSSTEDETYPMFAYFISYNGPPSDISYQIQNKYNGHYCYCIRKE